MIDFQDLDHLDGVAISSISANLYNTLEMIWLCLFSRQCKFCLIYTQSKIISENIKWNLNQKTKKFFHYLSIQKCNSFTGDQGYKVLII